MNRRVSFARDDPRSPAWLQANPAPIAGPEAETTKPAKGELTTTSSPALANSATYEAEATIRFHSPAAKDAVLNIIRHMVDVEIVSPTTNAPGGTLL